MILYFSGTGNSKHVAQQIAKKTNDQLVSLNDIVKQGNESALQSDTPYVFVCPTYAWRIPKVIDQLIRKITFTGSNIAYFILTCGAETGNAVGYVEKLCKDKGWELKGFGEILMPENYVAMFPVTEPTQAKEMIAKAVPVIEGIADDIINGKSFQFYTSNGFMGKLKSGIVNMAFYPFAVHAKGFYATDKCINCGKCEKLCPLNNIHMENGTPHWGDRCTHCMACICGCPTEAIEYKKVTQGKPRYYLD